jgi:PAS domain S-box-containing protein
LSVQHGADLVIARPGPGGILARKLAIVAVLVPLLAGFGTLVLLRNLNIPLATAAQTLATILILLYFVVRAARELERSSGALTESEARFRTVFERAPIGVVELDPQTVTILQANDAFCRIIGRTPEEVIGHTPQEFTHPEDREGDEQIAAAARAGRSFSQAKRYVRPDGAVVYAHVAGQGIAAAPHSPPRTIATVSDVTPLHLAEQERSRLLDSERAARLEAERAARSKDEFVAMVSHELRTPLNGILGWAQLLKRDPGDESTARRALEAIERGVRAQSRLVEDLLDMSRITAGRLRLSIEMTQVLPAVQAAIETIKPAAEAKQLRVVAVLDPLAGPVVGDPERLQQIVWNLLSNAVKFTARGGAIHVHLRRVESHVEITVSDTGAGIAAEVLPHIFDRYRQSDTSISRRHGGLGLGLAIVKQLVELHGGTVQATSPGENQGATFSVRLPLALVNERRADAEPMITSGSAAQSGRDLEHIRVLLIDDDEEALELASRMLCEHGARVATTTSGTQGLAMLSADPPDILLCDLGMPDMNGYEVVQRLRAMQSRVPAVAVTAFARAEDRIRSLAAGFNMHLSKPLDARELVTVVAALARAGTDTRNEPAR